MSWDGQALSWNWLTESPGRSGDKEARPVGGVANFLATTAKKAWNA